jgi:hypothetical protein
LLLTVALSFQDSPRGGAVLPGLPLRPSALRTSPTLPPSSPLTDLYSYLPCIICFKKSPVHTQVRKTFKFR